MYQEVKIGSKSVPMMAMASVDDMYEKIFHEDPIALQSSDDFDTGKLLKLVQRMGFVMAKFAELKDRRKMRELNIDDYEDWLDQFERNEYIEALPNIRAVYEGQMITYTEAKKNSDEPTAE